MYAKSSLPDPFGNRSYPNEPFVNDPTESYYIRHVTSFLHSTMEGNKIHDQSQGLYSDGSEFSGLYSTGEVADNVHGYNCPVRVLSFSVCGF